MPLPSFTVAGNLYDIPGLATGDDLEVRALSGARLVFTSNIDADSLIRWGGDLYRVHPVGATVGSSGSISLRLLANADGLNVWVRWRIDIYLPRGGKSSFWFDAPGVGGTLPLSALARARVTSSEGAVIDGGTPSMSGADIIDGGGI